MPNRPKSRDEIARNMSAIRSHDNRTEVVLRKTLHAMGFRYRKYMAGLPGRPDIVFPRGKVVVFVDGDYWHGRLVRERGIDALRGYYTVEQQPYWIDKLSRNVSRDDRVTAELQSLGWQVLRFWESDIKKDVGRAAHRVASVVRRRRSQLDAQSTGPRKAPRRGHASKRKRSASGMRPNRIVRPPVASDYGIHEDARPGNHAAPR